MYLRLEVEKSKKIVECLNLTACESHALLLRQIVVVAPNLLIYVGFADDGDFVPALNNMGYVPAFELDTRWETILKHNPQIKVKP